MVRVVREIEIVESEDLVKRAAENGEYLAQRLRDLVSNHRPVTHNVRGLGLYQGFSLDTPSRKTELIKFALEHHNTLLLGAGSRSIRTRPNLSVTRPDIDRLIGTLDHSLRTLSQGVNR
jgi:L-lysine 6-transaminase